MSETKYSSYEEAVQRETVKNLDLRNQELEKRMKLEESLNVLATFAIIGIIISILVIMLSIFGVIQIFG